MVTRQVRKEITEILINDPIFPPPDIDKIFREIEVMDSYSYKKNLLKHFLSKFSDHNPKFNRKIWKNIKLSKHEDQFLALLVGVTYMKMKKYSKACVEFREFLNQNKKFVLNSFVIIKLLQCYKRERDFNKLLKCIRPNMRSLNQEHKFIVLGYRALCYEIVQNKAQAENCYKDIERLNCRSSLACNIWLEIQKEPIQKGLLEKIDNLIGNYNGQILKDLKLLKAFLLYRERKFDDCIEILTHILSCNVNVKICLSLLGKIFYEVNQLRKSLNYYLITLNLGNKKPENWYNLFKVYEKCGDPKASELKKRALDLDLGTPKY
jgi:tetratricopeptide (TPR) repeat protein